VLALAKLGFLDFITGGFDTGRFGGLPFRKLSQNDVDTCARSKRLVTTGNSSMPTVSSFLIDNIENYMKKQLNKNFI
jgi:hypothetical protein